MVDNSLSQELQHRYQSGERDFRNLQLRRVDLHNMDFAGADFSGADFTEANLRNSNFQGCKFIGAFFNDADLSSATLSQANLQKATLIKAYLLKCDLQAPHLESALCTNAFFTRANLQQANLNGTLLTGANLTGAKLQDARYNRKTRFDSTFNIEKAGLKKVASDGSIPPTQTSAATPTSSEVTTKVPDLIPALPQELSIDDLLLMFDHLSEVGSHYLGNTMAARYWRSTRPKLDWFKQFEVDNKTAKLTYPGSKKEVLTPAQIELCQQWAKDYVNSCSMVFKAFTTMTEADQCVFPIV